MEISTNMEQCINCGQPKAIHRIDLACFDNEKNLRSTTSRFTAREPEPEVTCNCSACKPELYASLASEPVEQSINRPLVSPTAMQPLGKMMAFEEYAGKTLERAKEIFTGRGGEYGDTWKETRFLKMEACARAFGVKIPEKLFRILATAAFCDMKYWRMLGGYKDDSLIDGINYDAFLAEDMARANPQPVAPAAPKVSKEDEEDGWMQTFTGKQFWTNRPDPGAIDIRDIAHALSNVCRFAGHCVFNYNVAQHSRLVCEYLQNRYPESPRLHLAGLMHDAAEAYVGDTIRTRKNRIPELKDEERKVWLAVCEKFNIYPELPGAVKDADNILLVTERRDVMGPSPKRWSKSLDKYMPLLDYEIRYETPQQSENLFLLKFQEIVSTIISTKA